MVYTGCHAGPQYWLQLAQVHFFLNSPKEQGNLKGEERSETIELLNTFQQFLTLSEHQMSHSK